MKRRLIAISVFIIAILAIVGLNFYHINSISDVHEPTEMVSEIIVQEVPENSKELLLLKKIIQFILSF